MGINIFHPNCRCIPPDLAVPASPGYSTEILIRLIEIIGRIDHILGSTTLGPKTRLNIDRLLDERLKAMRWRDREAT